MPTLMAITISNSTVSDMQISITIMSSFGARRSRLTTLCASLMFQATISSSAAMAESGSHESSGARISSARITSREWMTAETGDVAPARTFAAERAIAAVAVIPPKNGATMLPEALADQLAVGFVLSAGHAVEHDGAEQGFDRAQHSHRERGGQQSAKGIPAQGKAGTRHVPRQNQLRQQLRNAAAL